MSEATRTVIEMFRLLDSPEKVMTKEELSAAIGHEVTNGSITTAKRHLLHENNMNIEWDREKRGFRNMIGVDNIVRRRGDMKSMRRKARRGREKISVVEFNALTDTQKVEACAISSIFGVLAHMSESGSVKKIENAVTQANIGGLSIGSTLSLFSEKPAQPPVQAGHMPQSDQHVSRPFTGPESSSKRGN
jgi:hypothetical protein